MPPKRDIYINVHDPVEKQYININPPKKKCSCKKIICGILCLGMIGSGGIIGYLYYYNKDIF